MVGEGDGGKTQGLGLGDDLGGGEGAVGVGGVEVEVDGHGVSFRGGNVKAERFKFGFGERL